MKAKQKPKEEPKNKLQELKQKILTVWALMMSQSVKQNLQLVNDQIDEARTQMRQANSLPAQMDILMTVLMVIVGAVALYVGLLIISNVEGSLPEDTTNTSTFDTISSNVDSAFVLIGVGFIVVAAGFIIGALITRLAPGMFNMNSEK